MSNSRQNLIWVSGERFNLDYLLDTATGEVLETRHHPTRGGPTGGIGRQCRRHFAAVYVRPDRGGLTLQVGASEVDLDERTSAVHGRRVAGALSTLTVSRPGSPDVTISQWNVGGSLQRIIDPAYDDLDRSMDDFLEDVAQIVESKARRDTILETKDPEAGTLARLKPREASMTATVDAASCKTRRRERRVGTWHDGDTGLSNPLTHATRFETSDQDAPCRPRRHRGRVGSQAIIAHTGANGWSALAIALAGLILFTAVALALTGLEDLRHGQHAK